MEKKLSYKKAKFVVDVEFRASELLTRYNLDPGSQAHDPWASSARASRVIIKITQIISEIKVLLK